MSESDPTSLFDTREFHQRIAEVSRKLFVSGHFEQAVSEAFKAVENVVKEKSGRTDLYGKNLMAQVFAEDDPILQLNKLKTVSEKDEQTGFKFIFMGVALGIRNPRAHETLESGDAKTALEYLALASLLLRRLDSATLTMHADEIVRVVKQKTFVQKPGYVSAMLDKIAPQLYVTCIEHMVDVCSDASEDTRVRDNAFFVYRMLTQRLDKDSGDLIAVVKLINGILDKDDTFDTGVHLLQPNLVPLLENHICEKTFGLLVEDVRKGTLDRGGISNSLYWADLVRLRNAIPPHYITEICEFLKLRLRDGGWYGQGFAARMLHELREVIPDIHLSAIMTSLMRAIIWDTSFSAIGEVTQNIGQYSENWITAFAEAILRERGQDKERERWLRETQQNQKLSDTLRARIESELENITSRQQEDNIPF